ncbi:hypothetical protein CK203_023512 [Vitis vinifera]|uniref:Disease resistance protein n=1 Tax=Vitis vinifera TaxID=29760 RepID=A0A438J6S0_VITVI|nr:hypothetical protein CK203_023512 [Vitis vinifera]
MSPPFPSLFWISGSTCNSLSSFPLGNFPSCPNLVSVELPALHFSNYYIRDCKNLKWLLHNATCFQSLTIKGCPELIFPIQEICDCPKLQFLTEEQLPTNLSVLTIQNCPLLKDRCKFWTGEDWHHIAHIPHIVIDDQVSNEGGITPIYSQPSSSAGLIWPLILVLSTNSSCLAMISNGTIFLLSSTLLESGGCSRLYDSNIRFRHLKLKIFSFCHAISFSFHDCHPPLSFTLLMGLPSNLNSLTITNCNKLTSHMDCGLQGLASLTSLKISGLPTLRSLDSLGLQLLTSLQKLEIRDCPELQSLTEKLLPTSLSVPTIQNCPC